jgi:formylmethanofuran dehydrogenase subunit A
MPVIQGTSTIKLQNVGHISIRNLAVPSTYDTTHSGDNILDGVEIKLEKGESIRVASGKDRAMSEKVSVTFEIVEGTEEDLAKLLNCNNAKCVVEMSKNNGDSTNVTGFLSVNRAVAKMISYKCNMEITAEDADTIVGWYV